MIDENHKLRDRRIESESVDIFGQFFYGLIEQYFRFIRFFFRTRFVFQCDDFFEELLHSFDSARAPCDRLVERSHEHLIGPQGISSELIDDVIRIDDVSSSFAHFSSIFSHDESDIMILFERFLFRHDTDVVQEFLPESRVDHMSRHVLSTSYIDIDITPIFFFILSD